MTILRTLLILTAGSICMTNMVAQEEISLENVTCSDSATITIVQPDALAELLRYHATAEPSAHENAEQSESEGEHREATRMAGYRVQVFSDNNQRTAKSEARTKERTVKEAFPEFGTYIVYNSPFWRLKVGDFKTQHEAEAAADAIKSRFPSFAREVRVVRDRINSHR